jgi:hypothetical protein
MRKEDCELDKLERKLKIEYIELCLNCQLFIRCCERKDGIVCCGKYKEMPLEDQLVIVGFTEYSKLRGTKNLSLSYFC